MNREIFEAIESPDFTARLTITSSLRGFIRVAWQQPEVRAIDLSCALTSDVTAVQNRVDEILDRPYDTSYLHPDDVALAVYLLVLAKNAPEIATHVYRKMKGIIGECLWWVDMSASKLAVNTAATASSVLGETKSCNPISNFNTGPTVQWVMADRMALSDRRIIGPSDPGKMTFMDGR